MKGRPPKREERALWRAAMRDVAPIIERPAEAPETAAPTTPPPRRAAPPRAQPAPAVTLPELTEATAPGLDRRSAERLRRGERRIEARLDLHGMTQDEAHQALLTFLARSVAAGRRCVLVITGKGGVLRSAVPRWLNERPNRPHLLAFMPAQAKDGGAGALYLLLRRAR
jgi:DNA-nicking Smr family endonuclease